MKCHTLITFLSLAVGVSSRSLRGLQDAAATTDAVATQEEIAALPVVGSETPTLAPVVATTPALTCDVWIEPDYWCNLSGNTLLAAVGVSNAFQQRGLFSCNGWPVPRYRLSQLTVPLLLCCAVPTAQ
jgi:hypothetical protein